MRSVFVVIRREYLQRVKNKWFILGTIALPVFLMAVFAIPIVLETRGDAAERSMAVIDRTGVMFDAIAERLGDGWDLERTDDSEAQLEQRVEDGDLQGYLVLDDQTLSEGRALYRGDGRPGTVRRIQLQQAIVGVALEIRLGESGGGIEALLAGGDVSFDDVDDEAAQGAERAVGIATGFAGAFMLYMVLLIYGVQVMRSVLEEKTTRIVEVIVSAIRPWQLMLGKIVGVGAVALTQVGIWVGAGVLLSSVGLPFLVASRPELVQLENLMQYLPAALELVVFVGFFVLGFFLYSSLFAATAAMCSTEEEAQQTQIPVVMLLVIPIMFLTSMVDSPHTTFAVIMSFVPFFSPVIMFPRFMLGAPLWQVAVSWTLMALTIVAVAGLAGRIYRVGILMQGKRPTLPELWRWIRQAG